MNILLAPDKFKGSLSAAAVCAALTKGIQKTQPTAHIISKPMADGGDGSLAVLDYYFDLKTITPTVQDPLGRSMKANYKMQSTTAYIEMAAASGLVLLQPEERNCMKTTSFGTGQLIADAVQKGATEVYLFIGGSATNDGGMGVAHALAYQFYDKNGKGLAPIGENLVHIHRIDSSHLYFNPKFLSVKVICDVNNPFYGKNGAAYVYAPQKGASPDEVELLNRGLINLANILKKQGYPDVSQVAGAGAAGGMGGGAIAFLDAQLQSGIQTFLEMTQLEKEIKNCDVVITGEGKLDEQTEQGKVISGVCQLAKRYDKKVIAVCGDADLPIPASLGIGQVYTVRSRSASLEEAMTRAGNKLVEIGEEIGRNLLLKTCIQMG